MQNTKNPSHQCTTSEGVETPDTHYPKKNDHTNSDELCINIKKLLYFENDNL